MWIFIPEVSRFIIMLFPWNKTEKHSLMKAGHSSLGRSVPFNINQKLQGENYEQKLKDQ